MVGFIYMGGKVVWHQVVLFSIFGFLTLVRVFSGRASMDLELVWWWLGGVIGFLFVFADRLIYALVSNPEEVLSVKVKELFSKGHLLSGLALAFSEREKQLHLMMRSALFVVVWAVLAVFTATSVGTVFPRGLVLGLGTHLIFDIVWDYLGGQRDVELWFWQVKKITKNEISWFFRGFLLFYILIIWFL